jgi:hypothetical protein
VSTSFVNYFSWGGRVTVATIAVGRPNMGIAASPSNPRRRCQWRDDSSSTVPQNVICDELPKIRPRPWECSHIIRPRGAQWFQDGTRW